MGQRYKAVYFPDISDGKTDAHSVTLAFGKRSAELYDKVKALSSEDTRQLLGFDSYEELAKACKVSDLPVNTYCLSRLKRAISRVQSDRTQASIPGFETSEFLFDPISVTFKGGKKDPFHRWYPYIEGYSADYVQAILEKYAPQAQTVLDPFSGTGTTAIVAAKLGKEAYFCEINPVLQFISLVKVRMLGLKPKMRMALVESLREILKGSFQLDDLRPDVTLDLAYRKTFGDSVFFKTEVYQLVLKTRTWLDYIACANPLLADVLIVATLASLVPASRLKRAGDLRYKTPQECQTESVPLVEEIRKNIRQIMQDIEQHVGCLTKEPVLLCENAHTLSRLPYVGVDAVVTSPPYVNGTNYFRNTKIELWFLRCLCDKAELAAFREAAVTAGINDVTVGKAPEISHPEVEKTLESLRKNAYDARIPRMVASYFSELSRIFRAVSEHLTPNAIVAVDIGDSRYGGVHVPSDRLLSACLGQLGFDLHEEIVLRRRRSRDGSLLKQSLLVFRHHSRPRYYHYDLRPPWQEDWTRFKEDLPHQKPPYASRSWGHPLHSLCSYPGKLKPAIAHQLVKVFVPANGRVLDPFAGVGTIPFEAALQGKQAYGFDISPAAYVVANAKVQDANAKDCGDILDKLDLFIREHHPTEDELCEVREVGFNGKIADYYESQTLAEIILARRYFQTHPAESAAEMLVEACLLHILHGNRPYALSRRSHPLTPYKPTGSFQYRPLIGRLAEKLNRSLGLPVWSDFTAGKMFFQDATATWPREIDDLDAVITSPPFFDSTRFYLANWLRLWFAGWSKRDFDTRPLAFVDERQKLSFEIYGPVLRQARERLKTGGVAVLHLGKSAKCEMAPELKRVALRWFSSADVFDESVAHCESHGIRDKGAVTTHQYLVLY